MQAADSPRGALVVVGTPIGNLSDLSPRGVDALASAQEIACEDTRRTGRLLAHFGIAAPKLIVANEHTETGVADRIVAAVASGARVAFVSDAGMPMISDPGGAAVRAVIDAGLPVEVVPGPSALDTALAVSGLPTGRFCFEGFLPRKGAARSERLDAVAAEERTTVLYEAPHRLGRTLGDLAALCATDRRIAVLRELTKLHETHWRGTLGEATEWVAEHEPRGEYVLVLAGRAAAPEPDDDELRAALAEHRRGGASTRDAVDAVTARFGVSRRRVYALAIGDDRRS